MGPSIAAVWNDRTRIRGNIALGTKAQWQPLPDPAAWPPPEHERRIVRDRLRAIENDTQPLVNAERGRWAIEMVSAVYHAQRTHGRVSFRLPDRRHPTEAFRS